MSKMTLFIEHDGGELQARVSVCEAEPDVGIMSAYIEDVTLFNEEGTEIKLSDEEYNAWLDIDNPLGAKLYKAFTEEYYQGDE